MIVVREIREDAEGVGNETSLVKVTKVEFPTICLAYIFLHRHCAFYMLKRSTYLFTKKSGVCAFDA